jgi:molecular chaperone GrpE
MTDPSAHAPDPEPTPQTGAASPMSESGSSESGSSESGSEPAAPEPMEVLAREATELKDRLLRALAEMENQRRRTEREVADARSYGISAFARDLLAVADNMRRALDAVGIEARENAEPGLKSLIEGVELTERELLNVLEKHGVKKLDPEGGKFDPHRHQAMFEVPEPAVPTGTVVQVVQPGYTIGERVLRPAMVAVSKGGPKPAGPETPGGVAFSNDNQSPEPE